MKKLKMTIVPKKIVLVVLGVIIMGMIFSNPLRWPKRLVQSHMLKLTPIGTSIEDVIKVIEKDKEWKVIYGGGERLWSSVSDTYINECISTKTIDIYKTYNTFLTTYVSVIWRFDDELKLKSIEVDKSTDVL